MSRISWHHLEASYSLSPNCWCNFCISGGCSVEINQEITQDKITVPSVYISLSQISVGSHLWTKPTWQIYTSYVMERLDFSCFSCSIFVLYCIILFTISSILEKKKREKEKSKVCCDKEYISELVAGLIRKCPIQRTLVYSSLPNSISVPETSAPIVSRSSRENPYWTKTHLYINSLHCWKSHTLPCHQCSDRKSCRINNGIVCEQINKHINM